MFYEPKNGHGLRHNPFKAIIAPRPIAWVSSLSADGVPNLAPFSFFNAVTDDPPIVMISCSPPAPGSNRDTRANILATKEYVIHIVPHAMRDAMNVSSGGFGADVDEFEKAGLTKAPSELVAPARIADAPIALECRYRQDIALPAPGNSGGEGDPDNGYRMFLGEVVGIHIADGLLKDGLLDITDYAPLARLGYHDYSAVFETFSLTRPG
jgi:flavin reductase (DIM6/NTAB) family NADH-FMN oxidoreductase RutF